MLNQSAAPGLAREFLEGLAEPQLIEGLGPCAKIGDAVDSRHVTDQAIRPLRRVTGADIGRHAEGRHELVVAPPHEAGQLAVHSS